MAAPPQPRPLVLASASPRRAELLRSAGYDFEVVHPPLDEPDEAHSQVDPPSHAESLAYFKARSVAPRLRGKIILGADTIAYIDGEIIGKPIDRHDAGRILKKLSGTTHKVITGLVLMDAAHENRILRHDISTIRVRALSESMIEKYLDTGQWQGKAGAYGIQDGNDPFVECLEGSFSNVVGLPMEMLTQMFNDWLTGQYC